MKNTNKRLICIDDSDPFGQGLTWGKEYIVSDNNHFFTHLDKTNGTIEVINDEGKPEIYYSQRFITVKEFREKQLEKLGI